MPKASDLKRGSVVEIDDELYVVKEYESQSPSSRGAQTYYKVRFSNVKTKQKRDESYKAGDFIKEGEYVKRNVQYSYKDDDMLVFMDNEDFTQYSVSEEDIGEQIGYLSEDLEGLIAILVDESVLAIEFPTTVDLDVVDTAPGIKGASATSRTKPATLSTGLEIQVPEYIEIGERVRVNTGTGKFSSRA